MNLYHPWHLILLLLVVPLAFLLIRFRARRSRRFRRFAEAQFESEYLGQLSPFNQALKLALLIIALAFVILALSRPQWDYEEKEYETQGLDIMICLDISKSMDAEDMTPSRLLRAKMQIDAFLDKLRGDRVGIIAFAGAATMECPLTDDYESVRLVLGALTTDSVVQLGTDIGAAFRLAENGFQASGGNNVLLLITDGEDLENDALVQARRLGAAGVRIYALGVGTEEGSWIEEPGTGRKAFSTLDAKALKSVAEAGKGEFFAVTAGQDELDLILQNIYRAEKGLSSSRNVSALKDQFTLPAALALLLLVLESLIPALRRKRRQA